MEDSIFTKIIKGEIPCHKIYEDELTFAFMDINPVQPGHVLVITKAQVEFVWDLEDSDYQALMATTKSIARRMREVLPQKYVHERIVGTDVPHSHIHLIPFDSTKEIAREPGPNPEPDNEALAKMAARLAF